MAPECEFRAGLEDGVLKLVGSHKESQHECTFVNIGDLGMLCLLGLRWENKSDFFGRSKMPRDGRQPNVNFVQD